MSKSILSDIFSGFISLVYPEYCLGCDDALVKGEHLVCTGCILEMPQTNYHLDDQNPLRSRLVNRINVNHAMALFKFSKSGRVQQLLHALKYKNQPELGLMLGRLYGDKIESHLPSAFDLIIPIPLHPMRRSKRGYNQSAKFAEGISLKLNIPFSDTIVERQIHTTTQTRKSKLYRWRNVTEVFHIRNPELIQNKRILLVDDVVTTGATLEACGVSLLAAGCSSLSIACIAEA